MHILYILFMIGTIAATCACIPQLRQLFRTKQSDEFNISTWLVWLFSQATSLAYSLSMHEMVYATVSLMWVLFYLAMVVLIYKYRNGSETVTEIILAEEA